jgi:transcriptional regulator with XRE-family HTH domain
MSKQNYSKLSEFILENYTAEEAASMRAAAAEEVAQLQSLQDDVTRLVAQFMAREKIGFNEVVRRLGISPSQFSKIQRGSGNITLATLAHIAQTAGMKVKIECE